MIKIIKSSHKGAFLLNFQKKLDKSNNIVYNEHMSSCSYNKIKIILLYGGIYYEEGI